MTFAESFVVDVDGLDALVQVLIQRGYETKGPTVHDGAVVPGPITGVREFPRGVRDEQAPGRYRLGKGDERLFAWAVGPGSWKADFFPANQVEWRAHTSEGALSFAEVGTASTPLAIIGARPCELAAIEVFDRVLGEGAHPDPRYVTRRDTCFMVVVECAVPAGTCFCSSMGTGPDVKSGFDIALSELSDADGHRFLARAGSSHGADVLAAIPHALASELDLRARLESLEHAEASMGRHLETEGLAELLARNIEHPRWSDVAERCLSCANCTMVCPTCFCSDVLDISELSGALERRRVWSSCFDLDHSYLHGGAVRSSTSSRYRQWMTHKLSTWWDQFDTSGCVGCGRCVTWCPVSIDITEEVEAIVRTDGAARVTVPTSRSDS
jgi:ferredoxin